jgi:hypothetical protein
VNLYLKETRRAYTPLGLSIWGDRNSEHTSKRPVWAESTADVRRTHDEQQALMSTYWKARYEDVLVSIEQMDVEAERERMLKADSYRGPNRCCDDAVLYPCVCSIAFTCAVHGQKCVGSHD